MSENPDVLAAFAESMYAQYRWDDAFAITSRYIVETLYRSRLLIRLLSRILDLVGVHPSTLPTHIACMYNLRHLHPRLFLLAHDLVEKDPDMPVSWYAVGVYYLITRKFLDARKFFRFALRLVSIMLNLTFLFQQSKPHGSAVWSGLDWVRTLLFL